MNWEGWAASGVCLLLPLLCQELDPEASRTGLH